MKSFISFLSVVGLLLSLGYFESCADGGPFDGKTFKGRIAYSADGNFNDPDDRASSAVALAILAEAGVKDRLVHFDYNCILPKTDAEWERIHTESVLGAADRYGYQRGIFHDCQQDLEGALASAANAINESSADDPLYFILAGPMQVPFLAIEKSNPEKRRFVYCISHSRWNDGHDSRPEKQVFFSVKKRSVIESGVNWVQIESQNRLSTSPYRRAALPAEWQPWHWMRDSQKEKVRFLWERLVVSTRPDASDSGMAWFLVTGNDHADPAALQRLLADHQVPAPVPFRHAIRFEAENFSKFEGFELENRDDKASSHGLNAQLTAEKAGRIRTRFDQPYLVDGRFDIEVRYCGEPKHATRFALMINGARLGEPWNSPAADSGWRTHTLLNVAVRIGDEVVVEVEGAQARIDYVQFNWKSPLESAAGGGSPN